MTETDDYCELCDLPRSQCVHGLPPEPPKPPKKASAPRVRKSPATPAAPARQVARRWTPPEVFEPLILEVLRDAGGELETDELFAELERLTSGDLRAADHERTPEGELRWRYAARRARVSLIARGQMTKGRPGVWQLA